jgi:protein SCO1/2
MPRCQTIVLTILAALLAATGRVAPATARRLASDHEMGPRNGRYQTSWPDGALRSDVGYHDDAYEGEYRTWYSSGRPYELRHYGTGHEVGLQQSWTETGEIYLNYEMSDGRRYGLVNATPCNIVDENSPRTDPPAPVADRPAAPGTRVLQPAAPADDEALPFYADVRFTPHWSPVAHTVAPFRMRTQSGATVSDTSLAGRPYVASFIYTQCAAVCPLLMRQLSRVQAVVEPGRAAIVSFSVTPEADSPAALATFGRDRGVDPTKWMLVTGDRRAIYQLARTSYFADDDRAGSGTDGTAFLHTEKLVLVDGGGRLRGIYNGTQPPAVDQLIADLARLTAARVSTAPR